MPRSLLSIGRHVGGALVLGLCLWGAPNRALAQNPAEFRSFVENLWPEARARGVSRATFDEAFRGVELDGKIIALTKKQSEFVRPIWQYIRDERIELRVDHQPSVVRRAPVLRNPVVLEPTGPEVRTETAPGARGHTRGSQERDREPSEDVAARADAR